MEFGFKNFTFQQAHRSRQTVAILHLRVPEFVEPENWPPSSPDLNPVDYSIWGALQQLVYLRRRIRDVEHLKEVLKTCCEQIGQDVVDRVIEQFRKRLSPVVATAGGHIEHRFDYRNVLGALRTLSYLRVLIQKYRTWTTKVNSPVYSAPPSIHLC